MQEKYLDINENGCSIRSKLYFNGDRDIKNIIVSCHGFAGDKENSTSKKLAEKLLPNHKSTVILAFDWPCHGEDRRPKITLEDCSTYIETVAAHAREKLGGEHIYANATSFGGYLLLNHLYHVGNPFERIVLRCPAVTMYELLWNDILTKEDHLKLAKKREVLAGRDRKVKVWKGLMDELMDHDLEKYEFSDFKKAILILHGTRDEIVPYEGVRDFAGRKGLDFIEIEGADHRFSNPEKMNEFQMYAREFFELED